MGTKAVDALEISFEDMPMYLRAKHSVYMDVNGASYYLTDVNDRYWRAQDTSRRNSKNHFVDCSELIDTVDEFLMLPFVHGKTIKDVFDQATFYASVKGEKTE